MEQEFVEKNSDKALEILLKKLEETKLRNPQYSIRAFAQKLGVSSGALSEILKGKRPLTPALRKKIAPRLLLSPKETYDFFSTDLPPQMEVAPDHRWTLSQDHFYLISNWWYYGILNLIKTRNFKNKFHWMAERLGLSVEVIKEAWERLFRMGFLEQKDNQVVRKHPHLKTTDNILDLSIRKSHISDLQLIEKSLMEVPLDLRDNTSCTFVIDRSDIPKVKEMIRLFQSQFLNQIGRDTGDEVYKMSVSFYPLTKLKDNN